MIHYVLVYADIHAIQINAEAYNKMDLELNGDKTKWSRLLIRMQDEVTV
jgi:hypothetical protein